jgi:SAM-dependent methyltransferase
VKIDIGCGPNKKEGFLGIDAIPFPGVDYVFNVGSERFPFEDNSIDEGHSSHFVEHLTNKERTHFMNEMYRVLKPGAKLAVICPYWASGRAYGDPTHQWPPITDFWFYYLGKDWRMVNAPHTDSTNWPQGYSCNFSATWGYGLHPSVSTRNAEYQEFAATFYKEAIQDIHATLTKL